jgi:hypothetical protein
MGEDERSAAGDWFVVGCAARRASEGDESGKEEWMSPRRGRRGVEPPDLPN